MVVDAVRMSGASDNIKEIENRNIMKYLRGHSMSNHPMVETVPPQILMKIYTFGLYGQKRRFAK